MGGTRPDRDDSAGMSTRLGALDARIRDARAAREPRPSGREAKWTMAGTAWRMVFELIASMALGAGAGYGIDSLFGTLPLFLTIFWLLGFAAGIRAAMASAREFEKAQAAAPPAGGVQAGEARNGGRTGHRP